MLDTRVAPSADNAELSSRPRRWADLYQTAEYLAVPVSRVRNWSRFGRFPSYRLGGRLYFDLAEVDDVIASTPARPAVAS